MTMIVVQQAINGIVLGSLYVLVALGLTLIYGVLVQINFAHADFVTLGAFASYFFMHGLGGGYVASIGVALVAGGALGFLVNAAIFAPLAAKAVQMAVSRQREYLADATSVQFTRNPNGLISALGKLADKAAPFPGVSRATQHLFIVNPVQTFTAKSSALLATHPDIADRIARLRNLGG